MAQLDYKQPLNLAPPATNASSSLVNSYNSPSGSLVFHVYDDSGVFSRPQLSIKFTDNTLVFSAAFHSGLSSKPDLEFFKGGSNGQHFASVNFRAFSSTVDISLANGQSTKLKSDGAFSRRHSVVLCNRIFYWKGHSEGGFTGGHLKLVDTENRVLAYYSRKGMSRSKWGTIDIVASGLNNEMVEGIVVSCITMAERERRRRKSGKWSSVVPFNTYY